MKYSFEQLPEAISQLHDKLDRIESHILRKNSEPRIEVEELFNVQKTADFLSLSVATIYSLVSKRKIPYSKKGKRLYFARPELVAWIKEGRRKTTTEIEEQANEYLAGKRKKNH